MANERSDWQLGPKARNDVNMIGQDGNLMHMDTRAVGSHVNYFRDFGRIDFKKASRA